MPPQLRQQVTLSSLESLQEPLLFRKDEYLPPSAEANSSTDDHSEPVSRNVTIVLVYTWFVFAGRSIWNSNVLATFAFLLRDGDPKAVGFMTAAMGMSQLLVSFPSGYLADKYRRDTMLKVASLIGVAAIATTIMALHHSSYQYLVMALCVWGFHWGVADTSLSALFADSIHDGQRAHYFTTRSVLINLGNVAGPVVALIMFVALGDTWTIRNCSMVMIVGQIICLPPVFLLCFLRDDAMVDHDDVSSEASLLEGLSVDEESNVDEEIQEPTSNGTPDTHQDETYDEHRLASLFRCLPPHRVIAILVATADVMAGLASGMSVRYFAIFLYDNLHINPVNVQIFYIITPLIQASLMKIAQILAQRHGRCRMAVAFKWTGITLMLAMIVSYTRGLPVWTTCTILLFRTAFMNATSALTKSVLMDHVVKEERAKWSALESLNRFSWSGSAVLGGFLVDSHGIIFNFCVTACLQFIATMPLLVLSMFRNSVRGEEENEDDDEDAETSLAGLITGH